jgi:peptide/nickel transport system permease protein
MATGVEPLPAAAVDHLASSRQSGLWRDTIRNLLRQRTALVGLLILILLSLLAIFADVVSPHDPNDQLLGANEAKRRAAPCVHLLGCPADRPQTILGTDGNSRDVLSRVIHGGRISLIVGIVTVTFAILIGGLLGAIAGYAGGWLDNVVMRIMDVMLAFPSLLLAIIIITVLEKSLTNAMIAIGIVAIPIYARVMRASVLSVKEQDFVTAARALGESSRGLLLRRVIPNSLTALIVQGTLGIGGAVLDVAALSFLGLGNQPPTAEWGSMIGSEFNGMFSAPWIVLGPGVAITLLVFGFNLLGDGLRDALDPRLNR